MSATSSLREIMSVARLGGVTGRFQFILSGEGGREDLAWIGVSETGLALHAELREADVTLKLDGDAFLKVVADKEAMLGIELTELFMTRQINIEGSCSLALKFFTFAAGWQMMGYPPAAPDTTPAAPRQPDGGHVPSVRRKSEELAARQTPVTSIERRADIPKQEFLDKYVTQERPVILTEPAKKWPLFKASREKLRETLNAFQGLSRRGDYISTAFTTKRDFVPVNMGDYLQATLEPRSDSDEMPEYLGNNTLPRGLYDLIEFPPFFAKPRYAPPRMWIGPPDTVTPLHRDPNDNFFVQIYGKKRFVMASPDQWQSLSTWAPAGGMPGLEGCDFDPESPDYARFPEAKTARLFTFEVDAGETLFIPEGWFHHVRSLTPSFSMSFWLGNSKRR